MGWLVGCSKRIGTGLMQGNIPATTNCFFGDGMEKSDSDDIKNKWSISNMKIL